MSGGPAAPQQGFVAPRIDFYHAQSFQQAGDALGSTVCPVLKCDSFNFGLAGPAQSDFPNPAAELIATIGLQLDRPTRAAVGNQQGMPLVARRPPISDLL